MAFVWEEKQSMAKEWKINKNEAADEETEHFFFVDIEAAVLNLCPLESTKSINM